MAILAVIVALAGLMATVCLGPSVLLISVVGKPVARKRFSKFEQRTSSAPAHALQLSSSSQTIAAGQYYSSVKGSRSA
jgi:cell division protein FtsW (lipid II flippase)